MAKKRLKSSNNDKSSRKKSRLQGTDDVIQSKEDILLPTTFKDDIMEAICTAYKDKTDYSSDNFEFCVHPFPHWRINNLINDSKLLERLQADLLKVQFESKANDLFKFSQSKDIQKNGTKSIAKFREILFEDFRLWLEKLLGCTLADVVDMSCAQYKYTDFLLCHDDKVEDRQIAFIYYLVPEDWASEDGGRLDLFDTDANGHPSDICKSLIPSFNSLVFFEVSDKSYHQVSEVLSRTKTRLSISGWFHSISDPNFKSLKCIGDSLQKTKPLQVEQDILLKWINPQYLHAEVAEDIQKEFEENSEIQLTDFLKPEMYESLYKELKSKHRKWKKRGPPNKRLFWSLIEEDENNSEVIDNFLTMLRSEPFFKLLHVFTDLELATLDNDHDDNNDSKHSNNKHDSSGLKTVSSVDKKDISDQKSTCSVDEKYSSKQKSFSVSEKDTLEQKNVSSGINNEFEESVTNSTSTSVAASLEPSCIIETRLWKHGCFTILDDDEFKNEDCLDCILNVGCEGWEFPCERGGYISYVARDEEDEIVSVHPTANCLSLVYRDKTTTRFVRYFDDELTSEDRQMYDIEMMFFEGEK